MRIKKTILNFMKEKAYKPITAEELLEVFEIPEKDKNMFLEVLAKMESEGSIIKNRKECYGVPERMNLIVGRLQGHSKGFGFLIPDNPEQEDVYINFKDLNGAMHDDRVVVRLTSKKSGKRLSGEVIKILERANQQIVGTYEDSDNFGFVVPDDSRISHDVFVPKSESKGAKEGQKVIVKITSWPEKSRNPEGKVIEVLGHKDDPGVDIEAIIRKLELPADFPAEVMEMVSEIPEEIPEDEKKRRKDLRDVKMVTIDGEDAKDYDDAVSIVNLEGDKVRLGVHIADVTHYVRPGTVLDEEARKRGTSIYLVDRVIPMLPEKLSNNLCSLRSNVERLAMSVLMDFDLETGELLDYEMTESIIEVNHRLTYNKVNKILMKEDEELISEYQDVVEKLKLMTQLSTKLKEIRSERGSVDFDFSEINVILDEDGKPIDIVKAERGVAEKLIEDFMIKTNEVVAEAMYDREIPFIYRVHEQPNMEKLTDLNEFLHNLGYHIKGLKEEVHPKALQTVLNKVEGEPEEKVVSTVLLRTMQQAHYHIQNIGHFGLASDCYSHFTSPIRRYPDLMIHRIIKEVINQQSLSKQRREELESNLFSIADHCSIQERKAMDAELESKDLKKVEYMKDKIGQEYIGVISSVMPFGFFVELDNGIEGLVHVSTLLDDYYHYHEDKYAFIGERTANIYKLGDEIKIEISKVDLAERQIDLEVVTD
ncbi:ribonuclease R [Halobacteroides halobius DSM 5150]|uniref:Ribonuclease R n=1 Tax=Halobacteroides halobius (strain ATCC 35273 / DSM 5150 / MD-1) TaxID=748449 RepID=L0KD29_HALHC|nr:ribonuclease R [Halobacteroides halobius]AGB41988.1 ribonuclease R [Halobacteroides halobius DSM 5150]